MCKFVDEIKFRACFLNKMFGTCRWVYIGINETHKELPDEEMVTQWQQLLANDALGQDVYEGDILIKIDPYIDKAIVTLWIKAGKPTDLIPPGYEKARDFARSHWRLWLNEESYGWSGELLEAPKDWVVIGNTFEHPHLFITQK